MTSTVDNPITEQQYQDLVCRTNTAVECAECAIDIAEDVCSRTNGITSTCVNKTSGTFQNLQANTVEADTANLGTVASSCTNTNNLTVNCSATIAGATFTDEAVAIQNVALEDGKVIADTVETNSLDANTVCAGSVIADCLTVDCPITFNGIEVCGDACINGTVCASGIEADTVNSDNATIENLNATETSIDSAEIDKALATELDSNYITHKNDPQEINGGTIVDHYILLPDFTNGNYFLEARNDGGTKLWSTEFTNSIDNIQMRWSQAENSLFQLIDLKATRTAGGVAKVQLHIKAFEHLTLYRQSQSTDNTLPPTIYTEDQLPEAELNFEITEYKGTFVQDIIFTNKLHVEELEMDSLVMDCVGVTKELLLTCDRDINLNPIYVNGDENQYVQNKVICGIQSPTWVTPATCVSCTCEDLMSSKGVAAYNGETAEEGHPIVHLGDSTCVHGSAEIGTDLKVNDDFRTQHIADTVSVPATLANDSLVFKSSSSTRLNKTVFNAGIRWYDDELNQVEEPDSSWTMTSSTDIGEVKALNNVPYVRVDNNWYEVTGFGLTILYSDTPVSDQEMIDELNDTERVWIHVYRKEYYKDVASSPKITRYRDGCFDELAVKNSECVFDDNHPLVYNSSRDAIQTTTCLEVECGVFDNAKVNCTLDVCGDTHIAGDLYVAGTTHTVEEETLSTGSDTIVLRQNNPSGMAAGEFTGIISHNYNGTDNLAFGSGNDGQFRLGHASGVDTTYTEIYYKDGTWYSSIDPEVEETVSGELTSYSSKSIVDEYTKYENAVFTVFDYTRLQPALTREEEANIQNNALLKFNRDTHRAEDIAVPTASEQVLTADIDPVTSCVTYRWIDKQPGIYCFATMAAYEAYTGNIPVGSQVVIAECNGYIQAEEM